MPLRAFAEALPIYEIEHSEFGALRVKTPTARVMDQVNKSEFGVDTALVLLCVLKDDDDVPELEYNAKGAAVVNNWPYHWRSELVNKMLDVFPRMPSREDVANPL